MQLCKSYTLHILAQDLNIVNLRQEREKCSGDDSFIQLGEVPTHIVEEREKTTVEIGR